MLAVKENTRTVTLEVAQEKEIRQILWILLDKNRSKIRIGVIYPTRKCNINNELKIMYNNISKKIFNCPRRKATSFNTEDFNPKVDIYIEGNKPTVIKGGRQLTKMAKNMIY